LNCSNSRIYNFNFSTFAERQALELILSENITKSQFTDNQTSIKV
jgi:hypothetical protein